MSTPFSLAAASTRSRSSTALAFSIMIANTTPARSSR
jgi:hypothetical protein